MSAAALLSAKPKAQVLLCPTEDERAALEAVFPDFLVLCSNGGLDPVAFAGRKVACRTVALAEQVLPGGAEVLKVLALALPQIRLSLRFSQPRSPHMSNSLAWAHAQALTTKIV